MNETARVSGQIRRAPPTLSVRIRQLFALILGFLLFVFGSIGMLLIAVVTLFQARRLYAEVCACTLTRIGFWIHGVKVIVHRTEDWPKGQVVYISNHTSALDPFIVVSLGLPNCRYFMSGFLRKIVPLWIVAGLMGTFWTPRQKYPDRRRKLFQRASALLSRTGESVFLTPEGQKCWVFNRGAFHLATSLKAPIVPLFFSIPADVDPGPWTGGQGFEVRYGSVHVYMRPAIDTSAWTVDEVDQHRFEVRRMYLEWAKELNDKSAWSPEAALVE